MGIFDKIMGNSVTQEQKLNQQEAFVATALAVAGSDGHVSDEEWSSMCSYIRRVKLFSGYSDIDFDKLFNKLFTILKGKGPSALVEMAKPAMDERLRLTAFCCAVDIALADGSIDEEEKEVLTNLMEVLEVPEATAVQMIEVMLIKNQA